MLNRRTKQEQIPKLAWAMPCKEEEEPKAQQPEWAERRVDVIGKLNPKIKGWVNYYRYVTSKEVFSKLDHIIFLFMF